MREHEIIDGIPVEPCGHENVMKALRGLWNDLNDDERRAVARVARSQSEVGHALGLAPTFIVGALASAMISQLLNEKQRAVRGN